MYWPKRAWLPIVPELEDRFMLPDGYREVWTVARERWREALIEGPFPEAVKDCGPVAAIIELISGRPHWIWADAKTLDPLTPPMPICLG